MALSNVVLVSRWYLDSGLSWQAPEGILEVVADSLALCKAAACSRSRARGSWRVPLGGVRQGSAVRGWR